jgi:hypothetical protein
MTKFIKKFNRYNQKMLDLAMKNHNGCMDHCLDVGAKDDQNSRYQAYNAARWILVQECNRSAMETEADRKAVHTVDEPLIYKLRRMKAERQAAAA